MKRNKRPKIPGPGPGDEQGSEVWESRMGIVRTFIFFAAVVTSLRVGKRTQKYEWLILLLYLRSLLMEVAYWEHVII